MPYGAFQYTFKWLQFEYEITRWNNRHNGWDYEVPEVMISNPSLVNKKINKIKKSYNWSFLDIMVTVY